MKIPFTIYDFFGYLASGFFILCAADYAFDGRWLLRSELLPVYAVFWILFAYIIGHIVAHLSSFLLEHKFLRKVLISPEETLFDEHKRAGFWPHIFPVFYDPFPMATRRQILEKARAAGIERPGRALFFHCLPIIMRQSSTLERLGTFLNLYGFSRNISMAALLIVPILIAGMISTGFDKHKLFWTVIAFSVSIGMFYRYLKFFKHYTEEVFRSYAALPELSKKAENG